MATYNGIKKIKIGDNIFNLYDSGNSGGTITQVKTTAGAHTAITVTSGAANFNVPTTAAHVGINFGYTTSGNNRAVQQDSSGNLYVVQKDNDANVKSTTVTAETTYYLTGSTTSTTNTASLSKHASASISVIADSSTGGATTLTLGNAIASGTAGAKRGVIKLYGTTNKSSLLYSNVTTTSHSNYLPDKDGTLAVTDDIPTTLPASDVYSWAKASTKPTYTASEVGALASDTTYVSKVTTTAGAHTVISNQSGAVSFNVPTKTSHLTNDSNFLTSHQDISGKFDKSGGTITGATTINNILTLYREGSTTDNSPAGIDFTVKDTTYNGTSTSRIYAYNDHGNPSCGNNLIISPRGNLFLGGGEAAENHAVPYTINSDENIYMTADADVYIQADGQTIADRKGIHIYTNNDDDLFVLPCAADVNTNNIGYLGGANYRWKGIYGNYISAAGNIVANGHSSAIGTIKDAYLTANKTVANNTGTSLCSFSLEAGVWLVHAWLRFPSNATGSRIGNIGNSGVADWQASMPAVNGNVSQLHFTRILNPTSTTTYHLNAIQTSGANMTMVAGAANGFNAMRAVRIQ